MKIRTSNNRSIFVLIEIIITFILFSFAVAVLLQVFSKGVVISSKVKDNSNAMLKAESIIEEIKTTDGSDKDLEKIFKSSPMGNEFTVHFDENWNQVPASGVFVGKVTRRWEGGSIMSTEVKMTKKDKHLTTLNAKHYFPGVST